MDCPYCKKTFSNEYIAKNHIATSKKCIAIQTQLGVTCAKIAFPCVYCRKEFTSKRRCDNHLVLCKYKIKADSITEVNRIKKELEERVYEVDDKFEQMASDLRNHKEELEFTLQKTKENFELELQKKDEQLQRELKKKDEQIAQLTEKLKKTPPKVTNKIKHNNNIENQTNHITIYNIMTPDAVEDFFQKNYKLDTLLGGQKALARFVNDGFLKKAPVYVCGDRSRQKFYIIKDGKKMEDTDCEEILKLTTPGLPSVKQVYNDALFTEFTEDVTEDDIQDNYREICGMKQDHADFKFELSKIAPSSDEQSSSTTDWKKMLEDMERDMLPNESRQKNEKMEQTEVIKKPDIMGYSRGKLMVYRDRYRKDGTIKGPPSIMTQIEKDETARTEYISFLQS